MAVIIGMKQRAKTYQLIQDRYNNYNYINNEISSNLLYLNTETNAFNDAAINFKNNFQIGYINDKITIKKTNDLLTINNSSIDLFRNTNILSNLNVNNYFYTSNNTTIFNNNLILSLNNSQNSFKIKLNDSQLPIVDINKDNAFFRNNNIYTSNIIIQKGGTLYTNFIDSPNLEPVVIKNMQFAESLRILTANIIQNLSIDNDIIFANLTDYYKPGVPNSLTNIPKNAILWNNYMINNNINTIDSYFSRPNINVIKYVDNFDSVSIGGSNILEFRTAKLNTSNIKKLVYSINNDGYMSIGDNYNKDIPLKINIVPSHSNIFQYTNINNINKQFSITSNGYINVGTINNTNNQFNINKNNNDDRNNTELISLNINNTNYTTNTGSIPINFIINDNISNFIFNFVNTIVDNIINITITITHPFIQNNIFSIIPTIYNETNLYTNNEYNINNNSLNTFSENIKIYIKNPINTFNINIYETRINDTFKFLIYEKSSSTIPSPNINNYYKITQYYRLSSGKRITFEFYIYKNDNYIYNYEGTYYPQKTNYLSCQSNNITNLSISESGNIGIGTNYSDIYNIYTSSALIHNLNCKTLNNPLTKNIGFNYSSLNDINAINNATLISSDSNISSYNFSSNFVNINTTINSNLNVLNGGAVNINSKTIIGGGEQYNNFNVTINTSNSIGNGLVIKNDIVNINPSLLIYSSSLTSYPLLILENKINSYKISINSNNNFQILNTTKGTSLIENNSGNNSISFLNNSLVIFEDTNKNIKIFMGKNSIVDNDIWYDSIDDEVGTNTAIDDIINIYGNLNFRLTNNKVILDAYKDINDKVKIGIGSTNTGIDDLYINLSTTITSNLTAKKDILLEGTILSTSDSNLKSNINKITNPLEKINNINGYTYIRTDTSNYETGLLAQEVINILPEVVKYENNHYNIAYGNMCGIFVECIKELNKKIEILNEKIKTL